MGIVTVSPEAQAVETRMIQEWSSNSKLGPRETIKKSKQQLINGARFANDTPAKTLIPKIG